jgi:hypothetical protein
MSDALFSTALRRRLLFLLAVFIAMSGGAACAGTVWMDNGDRITGTILSLDNGILLVDTPYGGNLRLQFSHVKTLRSDAELVIHDDSMVHDYYAKLAPSESGKVVLNGVERSPAGDSDVASGIALSSLDSMARPKSLWGQTAVRGRLDVSLNRQNAAVDSQDYAADFQLETRRGVWRNTFKADYDRSKDGDDIATDTYGGQYVLDRFLTGKAFWQARVRYKRDFVEEVSRESAYGTGPGYQFWDDELGAFSLSGLLGRIDYGYRDGEHDGAYAGGMRWNYARYVMGRTFQAYTSGEVTKSLGQPGWSIDGEVGLRYEIDKRLSLFVKYARDQVSGGRASTNQSTYGTGLGLSW